jgi:hypothetical protein
MGDDDESVVGLDEAQRELLVRIKAASNGPEHAKRRVSVAVAPSSRLAHGSVIDWCCPD